MTAGVHRVCKALVSTTAALAVGGGSIPPQQQHDGAVVIIAQQYSRGGQQKMGSRAESSQRVNAAHPVSGLRRIDATEVEELLKAPLANTDWTAGRGDHLEEESLTYIGRATKFFPEYLCDLTLKLAGDELPQKVEIRNTLDILLSSMYHWLQEGKWHGYSPLDPKYTDAMLPDPLLPQVWLQERRAKGHALNKSYFREAFQIIGQRKPRTLRDLCAALRQLNDDNFEDNAIGLLTLVAAGLLLCVPESELGRELLLSNIEDEKIVCVRMIQYLWAEATGLRDFLKIFSSDAQQAPADESIARKEEEQRAIGGSYLKKIDLMREGYEVVREGKIVGDLDERGKVFANRVVNLMKLEAELQQSVLGESRWPEWRAIIHAMNSLFPPEWIEEAKNMPIN